MRLNKAMNAIFLTRDMFSTQVMCCWLGCRPGSSFHLGESRLSRWLEAETTAGALPAVGLLVGILPPEI